MTKAAVLRRDPDTALVYALAILTSLISFSIYLQRGELLLYGDAVAHINIARKVFDSQTPGLLQLGTVWLPLPHLLMMPFQVSDWMWTTGIGGAVPSMVAYVFLVGGVFRLVRDALSRYGDVGGRAKACAWLAAAITGLNPNLLYLETTAMTEVLYLALFVWAVVFYAEFVQRTMDSEVVLSAEARAKLMRCAGCVAAAEWARYDGWFLAAVMSIAVIGVLHRFRALGQTKKGATLFLLIVATPVSLWLGYNALVYGNAVEFATGPYSAKAIERRTAVPGHPPHPGKNDPGAAALYFFKSAQVNMVDGGIGRVWALLLVAGTVVSFGSSRGLRPVLLLLVPLPFYTLSVAYSGVPVFVPQWWPFSYYNVRYGIQLLPAFASMVSVIVYAIIGAAHRKATRRLVVATILLFVAGSYVLVLDRRPVCFREAWVNSRTRLALERELGRQIRLLPSNATFLMYLGNHVGAMQEAGVHLGRVIHEGNHRPWKKPTDGDGLWEKALASPGAFANYVISFEGDEVDQRANKSGLTLKQIVRTPGQAPARIWEASQAR